MKDVKKKKEEKKSTEEDQSSKKDGKEQGKDEKKQKEEEISSEEEPASKPNSKQKVEQDNSVKGIFERFTAGGSPNPNNAIISFLIACGLYYLYKTYSGKNPQISY